MPRYPNIKVKLIGEDGNAFYILGKVKKALEDAEVEKSEIDKFMSIATFGSYDDLLQTVMEWVEIT